MLYSLAESSTSFLVIGFNILHSKLNPGVHKKLDDELTVFFFFGLFFCTKKLYLFELMHVLKFAIVEYMKQCAHALCMTSLLLFCAFSGTLKSLHIQ